MEWNPQTISSLILSGLAALATKYFIPWIKSKTKLQDTERYELVARAMALALLQQYPQLHPQELIQRLVLAIRNRWGKLDTQTADRIARAALEQAKALPAAAAAGS